MPADAIQLQIEGIMEDGEAIPAPPGLSEIMANPDHPDAVAVLIDASV